MRNTQSGLRALLHYSVGLALVLLGCSHAMPREEGRSLASGCPNFSGLYQSGITVTQDGCSAVTMGELTFIADQQIHTSVAGSYQASWVTGNQAIPAANLPAQTQALQIKLNVSAGWAGATGVRYVYFAPNGDLVVVQYDSAGRVVLQKTSAKMN